MRMRREYIYFGGKKVDISTAYRKIWINYEFQWHTYANSISIQERRTFIFYDYTVLLLVKLMG